MVRILPRVPPAARPQRQDDNRLDADTMQLGLSSAQRRSAAMLGPAARGAFFVCPGPVIGYQEDGCPWPPSSKRIASVYRLVRWILSPAQSTY